MLSQLVHDKDASGDIEVKFLYTTKDPGYTKMSQILFLKRVIEAIGVLGNRGTLALYLTAAEEAAGEGEGATVPLKTGTFAQRRRIQSEDLTRALGPVDKRGGVVCYICGVPGMTDELVDLVQRAEGMDARNVFCEKWVSNSWSSLSSCSAVCGSPPNIPTVLKRSETPVYSESFLDRAMLTLYFVAVVIANLEWGPSCTENEVNGTTSF